MYVFIFKIYEFVFKKYLFGFIKHIFTKYSETGFSLTFDSQYIIIKNAKSDATYV